MLETSINKMVIFGKLKEKHIIIAFTCTLPKYVYYNVNDDMMSWVMTL